MIGNLGACAGDKTPLYMQLARELRAQIVSGKIVCDAALPSERDLCAMSGMSRVTVRKAIDRLAEEGILFRRQGSGTFVTRRIEAGSAISGFSVDARLRGENPAAIWMAKAHGTPTEEEAEILKLAPHAQVARLGRLRLSSGEPLAIEHAVVPAAFLPDLKAIGESLYAALERQGIRPVSGTQRIRAALANPTEAAMLGIRHNAEIMRIERRTATAEGQPVEITHSAYRGDRYDFVTQLLDTDRL